MVPSEKGKKVLTSSHKRKQFFQSSKSVMKLQTCSNNVLAS